MSLTPFFALLALQSLMAERPWPGERSGHGMVYHGGLGAVLVLGGSRENGQDGLWSWDGRDWRLLDPGGPIDRSQFGLGYDPRRDRVVLHGGLAATPDRRLTRFGDTWEWDGRRWRTIPTTGGPGVRDHHAMAYDPTTRMVLLFGGQDSTGRVLADTWGWDGRAWRQVAQSGPPGRTTHRLTYDPIRRVLVMFGGFGASGLLGDTWEWNGREWSRRAAEGPAPRFATRTAFDPVAGKVLLYGGRGDRGDFSDSWSWDGRAWKQLDIVSPSERNVHELVTDTRRRRTVLYGGFHAPRALDEVWEWDGAAWHSVARFVSAPAPIAPGAHSVGFRLDRRYDYERAARPRVDFAGNVAVGETATPVQIGIWYPAVAGTGAEMSVGDFRVLGATSETLTDPTAADWETATADLISTARFAFGVSLPRSDAESVMRKPTRSRRDAAPRSGRFPLIIVGAEGGPGGLYRVAEHLASHGFLVVGATSGRRIATMQAANPDAALEAQTHLLEFLFRVARELPEADPGRFAVLGKNFDGAAAVNFQMRNLSAAAVVSLDGWEAKGNGAEMLRRSPWYDPVKLRVPYLTFQQADAPGPAFAPDRRTFDRLRYSDRWQYVLRGMGHGALLQAGFDLPVVTEERRVAYDFYHDTIRRFLDAALRADSAALGSLRADPARGFPAWLFLDKQAETALTPMPTPEELEPLVMSGDIARVTALFRAGRRENPDLVLFTKQTLGLYAFRFWQRGNRSTALEIRRLAVEAYPSSALAWNDLGNTHRDLGQGDDARRAFERALALVDADPEIATGEKEQSRGAIRVKIQPPPP